MSAAKAPPRKRAANAPRQMQVVTQEKSVTEQRAEGLIQLSGIGQALCVMVGNYADAAAIGRFFPPIAVESAKLADDYDIVARPIDLLIQAGPFTAILAAGLPFALQIMANHGRLDASKLAGQGVVPPEVLEAQMRAEMMRQQAQAMAEQQKALNEARQAQAEYERLMAEAA